MGKNKGKKGKKTPYAQFQSFMAKVDNELAAKKAEEVIAQKKERAKRKTADLENEMEFE